LEISFTNLTVLAFTIEVLTNFFKNFFPSIKKNKYTTLVAGVIGALLCTLTATGILGMCGIDLPYLWLDYALTGIVLSRGAGVINDLSKYLRK
jgi:hypothetical protein